MKRFGKVALLLAAIFVMTCGAAYAAPAPSAYPLVLPGDLVGDLDARLIDEVSNDVPSGHKDFGTLIAPVNEANTEGAMGANGQEFLKYKAVLAPGDLSKDLFTLHTKDGFTTPNKFEFLVANEGMTGTTISSTSFDRLLVRTTQSKFEMQFTIDNNYSEDLQFGLRGGFEKKGASEFALAEDCTLQCYDPSGKPPILRHTMNHHIVPAGTKVAMPTADTVEWLGKGATEYFVDCCENFGLAGAKDPKTLRSADSDYAATLSRDIVVARLSSVPFLRVRVNEAKNVASAIDRDIIENRDFRATSWSKAAYDYKGYGYFDRVVDVPQSGTYNMGVLYVDSTDCKVCGTKTCNHEVLPFVAVTNLGTQSVWIDSNYMSGNDIAIPEWLCNSWCGLCEIDDMMSGDKGSLAYYTKKMALTPTTMPQTEQVSLIETQSALWNCTCHIYPAFTNTFRGAGNVDIAWAAGQTSKQSDAAKIAGRVNTSWRRGLLATSLLCSDCNMDAYIWDPCDCLEAYYIAALGRDRLVFGKKVDPDKLDDSFKNLTLESYDDTKPADGALKTVDVVLAGKKHDSLDAANIVLTKVEWTVNMKEVGLTGLDTWWRAEVWNKLAIELGGQTLNASIKKGNASAPDFNLDELAFLAMVDGPQFINKADLKDTDEVTVGLFFFVVDGATDEGDAGVRYYKAATTNNRFLVYFDGAADGKFNYTASLKKAGPAPVDPIEAWKASVKADVDNFDATFSWNALENAVFYAVAVEDDTRVLSTDQLSIKADFLPGTYSYTASAKNASGDVMATTVAKSFTVVDPTPPAPVDSGGSSGCSMGFAPAALLLLAPLFFLKR